ncbi:MAG TPA: hypothetical protein VMA34_21610 [Terracidiphilus sp.]|nr:hypothetical protein [Terracidiphilus sp.]
MIENGLSVDDVPDTRVSAGDGSVADVSRRRFLSAAGLLIAGAMLPEARAARSRDDTGSGNRVVMAIVGGIRRAESFSPEGLQYIPHLVSDLGPNALLYLHARNEGVTAHFNAISSILTGNWQRVDDWGNQAPASPTLFEQYRRERRASAGETWVVASNKALTRQIGASSASHYGPEYGANVVFPKQLMLMAIVNALRNGRAGNMADRDKVEAELETAMAGSNYEGLGWNVFDGADQLDPRVRGTIETAIANFVHTGGPTSGDELTFFMTREIMRKFAPSLLVTVFSDVEAAHFGSYAMHLAGIRTADRLVNQLWQEIEANPEYRGKTTLLILPEFGRDPDGSSTNGFFNHRANEESTRDTWAMALGAGVGQPTIVERPIRQVDLCPSLAGLLGCRPLESQGASLPELRG